MKIAEISIGEGHPLALIAGLNVLEDQAGAMDCARRVQALGVTAKAKPEQIRRWPKGSV